MNQLVGLIQAEGMLFIFCIVALEQMGLPLPAFPALMLAGALGAGAEPGWPALLAVSVLACVLSDLFWFVAGRRHGKQVLHLLCKISLTPEQCVSQTRGRFTRHGAKSLIAAKFIPGLNTLAPPLAGLSGMPVPRFLACTLLGSLLWSGAGLAAGFAFRDRVQPLLASLERFSSLATALLLGALLAYVLVKAVRRQRAPHQF